MSLFENPVYRWRETYFILFESEHRPSLELIQESLGQLETSYHAEEMGDDGQGHMESLTLISPSDFAAMDIIYLAGEEIPLQVDELKQELDFGSLTDEEQEQAARLDACDACLPWFTWSAVLASSRATRRPPHPSAVEPTR